MQTGELLPLKPDVRRMRTGLLADELARRGHQVTWWASAFDHMSKAMLFADDTDVRLGETLIVKALKGRPYRKNISWQRYHDHAIIANKFRRLAPQLPRPDLIVASMPDHQLAYASLQFAKQAEVPLVVDVRDQWPDIFLDFVPKPVRPLLKLALGRDFRMVRSLFRESDALVSMMQQLLDWALERAGRAATWQDRVFYLGAAPVTAPRPEVLSEEFRARLAGLAGRFVVTFIGTFGKYYAPTIIAQAAHRIRSVAGAERMAFVIAGEGRFQAEVEAAAVGLDNMWFPGWLNQDQISALLGVSSVGVIPCTEVIDTFPNKAFTYMSAGLPVISSVRGDLRQLIADPGVGLHYEPNDLDGLVRRILELHAEPSLRARLAQQSKRLFDEQLSASVVYPLYADHLERIAAR